jgi:hypothetical protein
MSLEPMSLEEKVQHHKPPCFVAANVTVNWEEKWDMGMG